MEAKIKSTLQAKYGLPLASSIIQTIVSEIDSEMEQLDPNDAESHSWWLKFKAFLGEGTNVKSV